MKKLLLVFLALTLWVACKKENEGKEPQESNSTTDHPRNVELNKDTLSLKADSLAAVKKDSLLAVKKAEIEKNKKAKKFSVYKGDDYSYWPIKNSDSLRKLFYKTYTKQQQYTIAALNRIDTDHINGRDTLVVPNEFKSSFMDYTPFPRKLDNLVEVPKIIIFSYPIQAYGVYEKGSLVKWGPTNMGKKTAQTPRGLFFANWKGRKVRSTVDDEWILNWNFNINNSGGVGWHQYALPGYPASHSCLRLLDADAQWLYTWADQWVLADKNTVKVKGTPVIVFGDYKFGVKGVWHQLVENPEITNISKSSLEGIVEPYLAEIFNQQTIREEYNKTKAPAIKEADTKIAKDSIK
ncbi:L,D-transpeptidase [Flavobacterium sp. xlx-214]|uniref:L,D-transpeptidase n=1 Tax=unclassified Flavobacterium TaxID=196869 RepID=UPI0013D44F18|nr:MULTISPECIES: L,D-transpeptidase [unclassified Flavobacterium]MBA5792032.1 L,D-transpeptidase [Flavobacterium sp. xlx-221]QMI84284.1 L,D-transpeptidase [Flavobacterium sp. xlx-214]